MLVDAIMRWRARAIAPSRRAREFVMANNIVTGERYFDLHGKMHEIDRQLRQKNGYPFDLERLSRALQAIVDGRFWDAVRLDYLLDSEAVIGDFVKRVSGGWKIRDHVSQSLKSIKDLEAVPFLRNEGSLHAVSGEETRKRAIALGATLGFLDAVFALKHGAEIPEEMGGEIVFPGTVLVNPDCVACVACLRRIDLVWHFVWRELRGAWWDHDRVARLKTAA